MPGVANGSKPRRERDMETKVVSKIVAPRTRTGAKTSAARKELAMKIEWFSGFTKDRRGLAFLLDFYDGFGVSFVLGPIYFGFDAWVGP